jgi:hypothetical protein
MPSRKIIDAVPHIFDDAFRVDIDGQRWPFKAIFCADNGNAMWHEKTRHNIIRVKGPANLAESMRLAGYYMPRPRGLEWIEDVAVLTGEMIDKRGINDFKAIARELEAPLLKSGRDHRHVYWGIIDGRDRWELTRANASMFNW